MRLTCTNPWFCATVTQCVLTIGYNNQFNARWGYPYLLLSPAEAQSDRIRCRIAPPHETATRDCTSTCWLVLAAPKADIPGMPERSVVLNCVPGQMPMPHAATIVTDPFRSGTA